jgi:hypothetical protein
MSKAEVPPVQLPVGEVPDATADEFVTLVRLIDRLYSVHAPACTAVRDLFEGTPQAGTVIQFCEKDHHMDVHAHRMTNKDGSTTTWRR